MLGIYLYVTYILVSLQLSNFFSLSLNIENIVMLCKNGNVNKLLLLLLLLSFLANQQIAFATNSILTHPLYFGSIVVTLSHFGSSSVGKQTR